MAKTQKTIAKEIINKHFGFAKNKITVVDINYASGAFYPCEQIISIDFYVNEMQFCVIYEGKDRWMLCILGSRGKIQFGCGSQCQRCSNYR